MNKINNLQKICRQFKTTVEKLKLVQQSRNQPHILQQNRIILHGILHIIIAVENWLTIIIIDLLITHIFTEHNLATSDTLNRRFFPAELTTKNVRDVRATVSTRANDALDEAQQNK